MSQHRSFTSTTLISQLNTLWKYRKRSLAFFGGTMLLVVIGLIVCPRKYTSDAKLFVRVGRSSVTLDPTVTTGQIMGVETSREAEINSLLEVIDTRIILDKVIEKTQLGAPYESDLAKEQAAVNLKKSLKVWIPKRSNVIGVEYESDSPQKSQMVVETLVDIFIDEHVRVNSTPGSYEFFEQQTNAIKTKLDTELEDLRDAKIEYGIGSVNGKRESLQFQIRENQRQLGETDADLHSVRAKINKLDQTLEELPNLVVKQFVKGLPADAENNMREQLYNLEMREQELRSRFTDAHPHVVAIQHEVKEAKRILGMEQPNRVQASSAVLIQEKAIEKSLEAKYENLYAQSMKLQKKLDTLNTQEVNILDMEREVKLLEEKYTTYTQNLEQARIDQELKKDEITNISVVQPASLILKPSSPMKGMTLIFGFIFGVAGAVALAFVSESFSQTGTDNPNFQYENPLSAYDQPITQKSSVAQPTH